MNPLIKGTRAQRNNSSSFGQGNIFTQFLEFKKQYAGQDPNQILNSLIQSGQISQSQINQIVPLAEQLAKILK